MADYFTKHHSPAHHRNMRGEFLTRVNELRELRVRRAHDQNRNSDSTDGCNHDQSRNSDSTDGCKGVSDVASKAVVGTLHVASKAVAGMLPRGTVHQHI